MEPTTRLEATATMTASATPLETPETGSGESLGDSVRDAGGASDVGMGGIADPLPSIGFDPFSLLLRLFAGNENTETALSGNWLADLLGSLWSVYVIVALLFSVLLLCMYTYASMWRWYFYGQADIELRENEKLYQEKFRGAVKHSRLEDIDKNVASENPNDWKLAIIEADIMLDGLLKERGYVGDTMGERLKSISSNQLASLQDAWEAHKTRNMIAHEGPDFVLTKRMADETIARYKRVFTEFGVL
jgi:hypothetical protein